MKILTNIKARLSAPTVKTWSRRVAIAAAVAWFGVVSWQSCAPAHPTAQARRIDGIGGMVLGGGGGIQKVTTNSPGFLAGSGTTGNPLTATLSQGSGLAGTGSSGDALRVGAGSGITLGADDVRVNAGSGLTADLTNVRADLGTGLTFSSGHIVPNLAGGTCFNGRAATSLDASGTVTCGDVGFNGYGGTHLEWNEEFLMRDCGTGNSCGSIFGFNSSAGGAYNNTQTGTTTRPGLGQLHIAVTAASNARVWTNTAFVDFGSMTTSLFETTLGVSALSNTTDEYSVTAGFADVNAIDQQDGCYFLYDRGNVAAGGFNAGNADKFECVCSSNSTRTGFLMDGTTVSNESFTTVNAPVAALTLPSTNIYTLKVLVTGTTRAEFFVNGTKSCDINTNIPSGSARTTGTMIQMIRNAGTTNTRQTTIDRARIALDFASARSP